MLRAHPRAWRSGDLHHAARRGRRARRGEGAWRRPSAGSSALRRAGRGQGQHRRQGPADHRRLSGLRLSAGARRDRGGAPARGRRDRHRQDQSRSVRDRPGRRALALRRAAQSVRCEAHSGRIELGLRGGGGGGARAARARHRHRRLRPRAGGAQQHRRPEAEPRPGLDRGRGAGLPHARLRVGVRAHGRRRDGGAGRRWPGPIPPIPIRAPHALGAVGPMPRGMRIGVPPAGQRVFFGDREALRAYDGALARLARLGATIVEIDIEPFYETARLLYEGPWVAERYLAIALAARVVAGRDPSGDAPDHPRRRAPDRGRCLRGVLQARGAAPRARSRLPRRSTRWCCRPCRRSTPSSRCWPIRSSSTAGSAPTPISSTCSICAGSRCRPRCAATARRPASRCWRRPAAMRRSPRSAACSMPTPACRSARPAARSRRSRMSSTRVARRRDRARGRRRASLRHAAQRRTARAAMRGSSRRRRRPPTTGCSRSPARQPPKPGMLRVADGEGASIAVEVWALTRGSVRPLRRRGAAAAVDRHGAARRRRHGERLSGRGEGGRRRARHFELRRLARVHGRASASSSARRSR